MLFSQIALVFSSGWARRCNRNERDENLSGLRAMRGRVRPRIPECLSAPLPNGYSPPYSRGRDNSCNGSEKDNRP